jgi:hypothetical protein
LNWRDIFVISHSIAFIWFSYIAICDLRVGTHWCVSNRSGNNGSPQPLPHTTALWKLQSEVLCFSNSLKQTKANRSQIAIYENHINAMECEMTKMSLQFNKRENYFLHQFASLHRELRLQTLYFRKKMVQCQNTELQKCSEPNLVS